MPEEPVAAGCTYWFASLVIADDGDVITTRGCGNVVEVEVVVLVVVVLVVVDVEVRHHTLIPGRLPLDIPALDLYLLRRLHLLTSLQQYHHLSHADSMSR